MASMKSAASRYNSFDSRSSTQSHHSDPSSSAELKPLRNQFNNNHSIVKAESSVMPPTKVKKEQNLSAMVKKLMAGKPKKTANLVIPADFIAEDLKKAAPKELNFSGLHRKLYSKKEASERKVLTDVKLNANTRTLAMVLRSERELLSQNKEQEADISELKMMLQEKNTEVEKLKNLCLKQREEIKALESAILFPDVMNSQLQELLEKQGSELKQANQLIPRFQRQVTSLTGQLHCLAEDLAEVKADKYSVRGCLDDINSPKTPAYDQEDAANFLEFSSEDQNTPDCPDDMFFKDLNPCLTPYYAQTKSKEFEAMRYDSPQGERLSGNNKQFCRDIGFDSRAKKLSKSSDCCQCSNSGSSLARAARKSDENKCAYRRQINHRLL